MKITLLEIGLIVCIMKVKKYLIKKGFPKEAFLINN